MRAAGNIRHDHWNERELGVIYDLVNDVDWFPVARALLPRRSDNAIRTKMSALRLETGIVPGCIGPRAMSSTKAHRHQTAQASERLRQAIREMEAA